jgi:hypothetical protein
MYCPKCSQEQASADLRFCSKCGFRLEAVSELLAEDGVPVRGIFALLLLRRDTRFGVKMLFLSGVIIPLAFLLAMIWDSPNPIFLPTGLALLGIIQIGYRLLTAQTSDAAESPRRHEPVALTDAATTRLGLPDEPLLSMPTKDLRRPSGVEPPIVTEETTENLHERKSRQD